MSLEISPVIFCSLQFFFLHSLDSLEYLVNSKITYIRALYGVVALSRILALPKASGINRAMAFTKWVGVLLIACRSRFILIKLNRTGQALSDVQFLSMNPRLCD
ncbi:MAG: hypothetical protein M0Q13_14275 [Methanothrix sp.]|nr:hypothetical protein [Methanothrix sp.]